MKTLISWTMTILVVTTGSFAFGQVPMYAPSQYGPTAQPAQQIAASQMQYAFAQQAGPHPGAQYAGAPYTSVPVQAQYYAPGQHPNGAVQPASFGYSAPGCSSPGCTDGGCDAGGCATGGCPTGNCGGLFGNLFGGLFGGDSCHGPFGNLSNLASCGYGGFASQKFGQENGPFGNGGCCKPRWFDFSADYLFWNRDFSDALSLSSLGVVGPIVLSTNDLEIEEESGFRVTGAYLLAPSMAIEASYFGAFNWASSHTVTGNDNLFSVFSNFGSDPLNGFSDTGEGNVHSLAFSSSLDSGEINVRKRYVSANCLVHTSWLVGARYIRVTEDLAYNTQTDVGGMNYLVKADNDLVGAQIGTDMMICLTPRFKIGGEVKAGVYGTHSKQRTDVNFIAGSLQELDSASDVAFAGEAGLMGLFRITPRLALKTGYQVFYTSGIATAVENFNTVSPFSARDSFINNDGDAFYHGANIGFEWTW